MSHFAVLSRSDVTGGTRIEASRYVEEDDVVAFYRDTRLVHRLSRADILRIEKFDYRAEADACLREYRERRAGKASLETTEAVVVSPPKPRGQGQPRAKGTSVPAEGVVTVIEERVTRKP